MKMHFYMQMYFLVVIIWTNDLFSQSKVPQSVRCNKE